MIYIEYESTTGQVMLQHFMPFDQHNGIKNAQGNICTQTELLAKGGILVDSISAVEDNGKDAALHVDLATKSLYWKYTDRLPTTEQKVDGLTSDMAIVNYALMMGGLL